MASNDKLTMQQSHCHCLLLTVLQFIDRHDSDSKLLYHHCLEINKYTACERLNMMLVQVPVCQSTEFVGLIIFKEIEFSCD